MAGVFSCNRKGKSKEKESELAASIVDSTLKKTNIKFDELEKDMGVAKEGEKVTIVYELLNTGNADLFIQNVRASCGCTTPKYNQKPIRPGKKGTIELVFDTKGRPGIQRRTVMVTTNTEPPNTVLTFNCEVIPAK